MFCKISKASIMTSKYTFSWAKFWTALWYQYEHTIQTHYSDKLIHKTFKRSSRGISCFQVGHRETLRPFLFLPIAAIPFRGRQGKCCALCRCPMASGSFFSSASWGMREKSQLSSVQELNTEGTFWSLCVYLLGTYPNTYVLGNSHFIPKLILLKYFH